MSHTWPQTVDLRAKQSGLDDHRLIQLFTMLSPLWYGNNHIKGYRMMPMLDQSMSYPKPSPAGNVFMCFFYIANYLSKVQIEENYSKVSQKNLDEVDVDILNNSAYLV